MKSGLPKETFSQVAQERFGILYVEENQNIINVIVKIKIAKLKFHDICIIKKKILKKYTFSVHYIYVIF